MIVLFPNLFKYIMCESALQKCILHKHLLTATALKFRWWASLSQYGETCQLLFVVISHLLHYPFKYFNAFFIALKTTTLFLADIDGTMFETLPRAAEVPGLQSCRSVKDLWQSCSCSYSMRLEWYPCLLKYCRNKDTLGHSAPYKCGIKSCSKGYDFTYYTPHKQLCLWEEET